MKTLYLVVSIVLITAASIILILLSYQNDSVLPSRVGFLGMVIGASYTLAVGMLVLVWYDRPIKKKEKREKPRDYTMSLVGLVLLIAIVVNLPGCYK